MQYTDYIPEIESIAREAGGLLKNGYAETERHIEHKGAVDLVTKYDKESDKLILTQLKKKFPDHAILAEESGRHDIDSDFVWVVDPLDGTTNFAHGMPVFAVSIALGKQAIKGDQASWYPVAGIVFDPLRDELFSASKGGGAYLNNHRLQVSETETLDKALLATGFPYDVRTAEPPYNNFDYFVAMHLKAQAIRRAGAAALDAAYVAAGRFDAYWEMKTNVWDIGAAALMVEEAGGKLTDFSGKPGDYSGREVLVSNSQIHDELLSVLKDVIGRLKR